MIKVKNSKVINETTFALLKYNKKRNIVATIAIVLTALMFTSLFTIGFGLNESMQRERMRMVGGDYHLGFKHLNEEKLYTLKAHDLVSEYGVRTMVGLGKNPEFYGTNVEVSYGDENYLSHSFIELTEGTLPTNRDEILIDTKVLDLLGLEHRVGQEIELSYSILDSTNNALCEEKSDVFKISGIFKGDELSQAAFIYLSKDYVESLNIPANNYFLNVMLDNSSKMEDKAEKIIRESGYSPIEEGNPDGEVTDVGFNWAYTSTSIEDMDLSIIIPVVLLLIIIVFTGYLIIYNTFNISSYLDIKIYGLMKAIGTSYKQLKGIILRQALIISLWSIPIGTVFGYVLGNKILPLITDQSVIGSNFEVSTSPLIFIFTIVMTLFTIYISARKPGVKVGKVSPLVAINAEDIDEKVKRNMNKNLSVKSLGSANTKRNKSKLILVVLSLSLSTIILNSTMIFLGSPDMDKYLEQFINSDFVIAEKAFFTYSYEIPLDDNIVEYIESQSSFESGGSIYDTFAESIDIDADQSVNIYGLDDAVLAKQEVILGVPNLDINNLQPGEIIYGLRGESELEELENGTYKYALNDMMRIEIEGKLHEYKIVGFIHANNNNTSKGYFYDIKIDENGEEYSVPNSILYMNMDEYREAYSNPSRMVYQFDANDIPTMTEALEKMLERNTQYKMDSRELQKDSLNDLLNLILLIGGLLSTIIGAIGILNFINVIMTNIISREKELSLMEAIGMTKSEIVKMLNVESLHYVVYTAVIGTVLSVVVAEFLLKPVMRSIYFTRYSLSLKGVFIIIPIFTVLALTLPRFVYVKLRRK